MLKIEVIKFEAQDVITASTAALEEPKCICPTSEDLLDVPTQDDYYYCGQNNHPGCKATDHHCPEYVA